MWSLFSVPINNIQRLILCNNMWEQEVYNFPTYLGKHTAKEVQMHRRTCQFMPEAESPIFKKYSGYDDDDI